MDAETANARALRAETLRAAVERALPVREARPKGRPGHRLDELFDTRQCLEHAPVLDTRRGFHALGKSVRREGLWVLPKTLRRLTRRTRRALETGDDEAAFAASLRATAAWALD